MTQGHEALPIAVTGVGVLTPVADDLDALGAALKSGRSPLEEAPGPDGFAAARLSDFDSRRYANVRGMRVYPRNTQLQICAATLALRAAGLEPSQLDPNALGTITASSYAHMETLLEYDRSLFTVGIQRTNPTLFPLALPSAPGALTALALGAKAFAITVNDGGAAGLAALGLGARLLDQGRAQVCVVTGAWTHCRELALSAAQAGLLTDRAGFGVFDRESLGTMFGELAVALVLEPAHRAQERGQEPLGYVRGQGAAFAGAPELRERALVRAGRTALRQAGCASRQLSLVSAGASGLPASDEAEARALYELLGEERAAVSVTAPKSLLGESLDASGLLQTAVGLEALRSGIAPPILGLREPSVPGLRYLVRAGEVATSSRSRTLACASTQNLLVTSISQAGGCSALVLSVNA